MKKLAAKRSIFLLLTRGVKKINSKLCKMQTKQLFYIYVHIIHVIPFVIFRRYLYPNRNTLTRIVHFYVEWALLDFVEQVAEIVKYCSSLWDSRNSDWDSLKSN